MPGVVLYFKVHQPWRLRRYSVFDLGTDYFDDARNAEILRRVADKCYRPATRLILDLIRRHAGAFRVSFSLTGALLEQLERWAPDVLDLFREVVRTGCCELLAETYHHSLACLSSPREFDEQVALHARKLDQVFGVTPRVFANTELIYSNDLARHLAGRCDAILTEGTNRNLGPRSPGFLYAPPGRLRGTGSRPLALLLKNDSLSDDIAFRFSNRSWPEWPLTPAKFADWVSHLSAHAPLCNLFMDYETFGEHQWADTGIFEFLAQFPGRLLGLDPERNRFLTPSQAAAELDPAAEYDCPEFISWADSQRDLSAWRGNAMQVDALDALFRLEAPIKERLARADSDAQRDDARELLADWRRLTTSDHAYYMCTKYFADAEVHSYFSPYDSPYDAYINFMNVLGNLASRIHPGHPVPPNAAGPSPAQALAALKSAPR